MTAILDASGRRLTFPYQTAVEIGCEMGCLRQQTWNLVVIRPEVLAVKSIACSLLALVLCLSAVAQQPTRLTVEDAKKLVTAALPSKTRHLPQFGLEQYQDAASPEFYSFVAYWAGAPNGSMVIGHYAVDSSTGDVWNVVMACEELSTPALRKLQAQVRSRIGLSKAEYRKLKRSCPLEIERK